LATENSKRERKRSLVNLHGEREKYIETSYHCIVAKEEEFVFLSSVFF
jgi:hypothetical protein